MTRNRVLGLAAAVLAGIGIVVGTFIAGSRDNGSSAVAEALPERAISVSGHGEVLIQPDVAVLQVGVSVLDESVAAARERAATAMDKVLASVKGNGVADDDIQTTSFSIQPEYDYSDNTAKLRGFRVFNSVSIKIRKLDSASKVIDDAVAAGGDDAVVNGITRRRRSRRRVSWRWPTRETRPSNWRRWARSPSATRSRSTSRAGTPRRRSTTRKPCDRRRPRAARRRSSRASSRCRWTSA